MAVIASVTLFWTFTTPFGGVADETNYAAYANVVASGQGYGQAKVPTYIAGLQYLPCFAFQPGVTARCQQQTPWRSLGPELTDIDRSLMLSGYPETYFYLVGQPSRIFSGFPALYLMRLVAWGLGMVLVALAVIFWPIRHRVSLVMATLLVSTPLVGSFFGAVNANGFEILAGFALAGLLAALLLKSEDSPQPLRTNAKHLVSIFVAMLALSVAKPYSYLFTLMITSAFLATAGVVALQNRWGSAAAPETGYRRPVLVLLLGQLALSILVGYASNATYRSVMAASGTRAAVLSLWDANWRILNNVTTYALELVGYEVLGWRDHGPPLFAILLWGGALVALIGHVLGRMVPVYRVLFLGFILGVLWVVPVFSSRALGLLGGAPFQARYVGSVFCAIPFIAVAYLFMVNRHLETSPVTEFAPALVSGFFALHVVSVAWSFLRFSVGFPLFKHPTFWRDIQWVPDYWPMAVAALSAFGVSSAVLRRQLRRPAGVAGPDAPEESPEPRRSVKTRIRRALFP